MATTSKYGARVISVNLFEKTNSAAILVKVVAKDGKGIKPIIVDIKGESLEAAKAMIENGLGKSASITFEASGILAWQPGVDRTLPAKDNFPAQNIHNLSGYRTGSIVVERSATRLVEEEETDEQQLVYARRLVHKTKMAEILDNAVAGVKSAVATVMGK